MSTGNRKGPELFRIAKSENKNIVIYEAVVDQENPERLKEIYGYWVMNQKGGYVEEFNWIDRKFAYGIVYDEKKEDYIIFHVVSLPKFKIKVELKDGKWIARTIVNDTDAILDNIFIDVTTVILIKPTIHSITINAKSYDAGETVVEILKP